MSSRMSTRRRAPKRRDISRSRSTAPKKQTFKSRRSYAGPTRAIAAPSVGLGQSARTVLKTVFFANVTPSATNGVFTGYLQPGSCKDPCGDLTNIQPALFDQWQTMYARYVVEKAWVKLEFANQSSSSTSVHGFVVAAYPSVNATPVNAYQGAASQPFAKTLLHGPFDNSSSSSMTFKLDHAKVLGRKGPVTAEDNGALTSSDPYPGSYMVLPLFIQNSANVADVILIRVTMYQTVFFDKRINVVDN